MNTFLQEIIRKKSAPLKNNFFKEKISSPRGFNLSLQRTNKEVVLNSLKRLRKKKELSSPESIKFIRKTVKYDGFFRKITTTRKIKLPPRESLKDVRRGIMNQDERKLMDSLETDHKIISQDISVKLAMTLKSHSRSPKRKLKFQFSDFLK